MKKFASLSNLSIKQKLYISGTIFSALIFIISFIVYTTTTNLRSMLDFESNIYEVELELAHLHTISHEFITLKDMKSYEKFTQTIEQLKTNTKNNMAKAPDYGITLDATEVIQAINTYKKDFETLKELTIARGLDEKLGIIGEFREQTDALESQLNSSGLDNILVKLLMCRRHEKDYILRGSEKYITQIQEQVGELKAQMNQAGMDQGALSLADNYLAGFMKLVEIDKQIKIADEAQDKSFEAAKVPVLGTLTSFKSQTDDLIFKQITILAICGITLILAFLGLGYIVLFSVVKPLFRAITFTQEVSKGDLTLSIDHDKSDEVGTLYDNLNHMVKELKSTITNVNRLSTTVSQSTAKLASTSTDVHNFSMDVSNKTSSMSKSIQNSNDKLGTVNDSTKQMTQSIQNITISVSEMSTSLNEVAENCQREARIAEEANGKLQNAQEQLSRLNEATGKITNIVETINKIANQTNLLALNATIEAASAGDAGRGFAVVASEVKELAKQTGGSTDEIRGLVDNMQSIVTDSISSIESIFESIREVNNVSQTIVAAVEEQSATMNEISTSVNDVSNSSTLISQNMEETSKEMDEVKEQTLQVNSNINESTKKVQEIDQEIDVLAERTTDLSNSLKKFKT